MSGERRIRENWPREAIKSARACGREDRSENLFLVYLVAEKANRRLMGAQFFAVAGIERIDAIAAGLAKNITLDELAWADFGYTPCVGPVWDPIAVAARAAK